MKRGQVDRRERIYSQRQRNGNVFMEMQIIDNNKIVIYLSVCDKCRLKMCPLVNKFQRFPGNKNAKWTEPNGEFNLINEKAKRRKKNPSSMTKPKLWATDWDVKVIRDEELGGC